MFITVEPKYVVAVESCIYYLLHSFVVNDMHDHHLLIEHFSMVYINCPYPKIYTSKFNVSHIVLISFYQQLFIIFKCCYF